MLEASSVENVKNCPVRLGVEVPRGIFGRETVVKEKLLHAKEHGISIALCSTLDALALAKQCGMEVHGGWALHCFNSLTASVLTDLGVKSITLSPELTLQQANELRSPVPRGLFAYGRLPLMLTRNCPVRNVMSCKDCGRKQSLLDRKGIRFPVRCRFGSAEVLNAHPIYLGDRMHELADMDFLTFFFSDEPRQMVDAVLDAYRKGRPAKGKFTRGLYYRGVE